MAVTRKSCRRGDSNEQDIQNNLERSIGRMGRRFGNRLRTGQAEPVGSDRRDGCTHPGDRDRYGRALRAEPAADCDGRFAGDAVCGEARACWLRHLHQRRYRQRLYLDVRHHRRFSNRQLQQYRGSDQQQLRTARRFGWAHADSDQRAAGWNCRHAVRDDRQVHTDQPGAVLRSVERRRLEFADARRRVVR